MPSLAAGPLAGARFPGRYMQGPGALARLGQESMALASRALVLLDRGIGEHLEDPVRASFDATADVMLMRHGGECTEAEIARVVAVARARAAGVIVGVGGGKVLDTAKAAADDLRLPVVVVPTIAASDAPCSALAVIYRDDGRVDHDRFLPRNPDLVLVDTALIARAPARFLAAGMGDALATWYEADACRRSAAPNCMGMPGVMVAHTIAAACRDTLFAHGVQALAECDAQAIGPSLERIVEANILMSGVGFESGGVATAHAIHHGLCELDEVHGHLHGEKVAIGVLVGLLMHGDRSEFERVRSFCLAVRLPTRLADVGITEATDETLQRIAERACRPGEIIHHEPLPVQPGQVVAALRALG